MKFSFKSGTHHFHDDPNFNYQMNRWMIFGNIPESEIRSAANKIHGLEDWKREFLLLAHKAHERGDLLQEACCYRAVDFFQTYDDPEKAGVYDKLVALFREYYKEFFAGMAIQEYRVPYDKIYLPVWYAKHKEGTEPLGTIIMTGGFDCYKEELIPVFLFFADKGFDFYYFEGPGQGEVLIKSGYPMTHEWEKPVKAVLDFFKLEDVTLIGLSLGGYLAPRAAVYESRIKRVIAWGTMYDFFQVVSTRRGRATAMAINTLLSLRLAPVMNMIMKKKMKRDAYTRWGIDHGMHVMGVSTPYAYFGVLKRYTMKKIAHLVNQKFLLLAGSEDHFVDIKWFYELEKKLVNVKSYTGRIFNRNEQAENHCQFGNLGLVLNMMSNWIEFECRKE